MRQHRVFTFIAAISLLTVPLFTGCRWWQGPSREEAQSVQMRVDDATPPVFVGQDDLNLTNWEWTRQVYSMRQYEPAWFERGQLLPGADATLKVLENASSEGLRPGDFDAEQLRAAFNAFSEAEVADRVNFDAHLTDALVRFVSQLCDGVGAGEQNAKGAELESSCDVPQIVYETIAQGSVAGLGERLSPPLPEYQGLRAALQRYREIAVQGGWKPISLGTMKSKPGVPIDRTLAEALALSGDLTMAPGEATDEEITAALDQFRARHGLDEQKNANEAVLAALSVPVEQRIEQIEINMDRMRLAAQTFEPNHIRVNIPAFQLTVHENGQSPLQMRVIVGSKEDPTPQLNGKIEHLVFSPYWNVPLSIVKEELLPKIKSDPGFLRRQQLEVVRSSKKEVRTVDPSDIDWDEVSGEEFQLRQKPGIHNALGLVKFIFPNPHHVYLHDTPSDNLFDRLTRTLSHGCVRLERPVDLAAYLLRDEPEWTAEAIEAAMHSGKEKLVPLPTPMPVHIIYWTAWADGEGKVHFREDVYGLDAAHRARLQPAASRKAGK